MILEAIVLIATCVSAVSAYRSTQLSREVKTHHDATEQARLDINASLGTAAQHAENAKRSASAAHLHGQSAKEVLKQIKAAGSASTPDVIFTTPEKVRTRQDARDELRKQAERFEPPARPDAASCGLIAPMEQGALIEERASKLAKHRKPADSIER